MYGKLPIEALVTLDIDSEASFHFHRIQWIELNLGPNKGRLIETESFEVRTFIWFESKESETMTHTVQASTGTGRRLAALSLCEVSH